MGIKKIGFLYNLRIFINLHTIRLSDTLIGYPSLILNVSQKKQKNNTGYATTERDTDRFPRDMREESPDHQGFPICLEFSIDTHTHTH